MCFWLQQGIQTISSVSHKSTSRARVSAERGFAYLMHTAGCVFGYKEMMLRFDVSVCVCPHFVTVIGTVWRDEANNI